MRTFVCFLTFLGLLPLIAFSLPAHISPPGEKMVMIDPKTHEWGAYWPNGVLIRHGTATTGKAWCPDIHAPCRTRTGNFHVFFMGDANCKSERFPLPHGGARMPYCMYFSGDQALHGSSPWKVAKANLSHGCVRTEISDARWLHNNFVEFGTLVRVLPY